MGGGVILLALGAKAIANAEEKKEAAARRRSAGRRSERENRAKEERVAVEEEHRRYCGKVISAEQDFDEAVETGVPFREHQIMGMESYCDRKKLNPHIADIRKKATEDSSYDEEKDATWVDSMDKEYDNGISKREYTSWLMTYRPLEITSLDEAVTQGKAKMKLVEGDSFTLKIGDAKATVSVEENMDSIRMKMFNSAKKDQEYLLHHFYREEEIADVTHFVREEGFSNMKIMLADPEKSIEENMADILASLKEASISYCYVAMISDGIRYNFPTEANLEEEAFCFSLLKEVAASGGDLGELAVYSADLEEYQKHSYFVTPDQLREQRKAEIEEQKMMMELAERSSNLEQAARNAAYDHAIEENRQWDVANRPLNKLKRRVQEAFSAIFRA